MNAARFAALARGQPLATRDDRRGASGQRGDGAAGDRRRDRSHRVRQVPEAPARRVRRHVGGRRRRGLPDRLRPAGLQGGVRPVDRRGRARRLLDLPGDAGRRLVLGHGVRPHRAAHRLPDHDRHLRRGRPGLGLRAERAVARRPARDHRLRPRRRAAARLLAVRRVPAAAQSRALARAARELLGRGHAGRGRPGLAAGPDARLALLAGHLGRRRPRCPVGADARARVAALADDGRARGGGPRRAQHRRRGQRHGAHRGAAGPAAAGARGRPRRPAPRAPAAHHAGQLDGVVPDRLLVLRDLRLGCRRSCATSTASSRPTGYVFFLVAVQMPGYFSAAWLVERWGRKPTLATYLGGERAGHLRLGAGRSRRRRCSRRRRS